MGSTKVEAPEPIDPGKAAFDYVKRLSDPAFQQQLLSSEQKYRPQFLELDLADMNTLMRGTDSQKGLIDLQDEAGRAAYQLQQESLQEQRRDDVEALQEFSPQVVGAYREADPYSAGIADQMTSMADMLFERARSGLTPEQKRNADQQAREAAVARGRALDNSSIASELFNRDLYRQRNRQEAMQVGQAAFGMNRSMAGDLGSVILNRPSQVNQLGSNTLGRAQAQQQMGVGPRLFDPNVGINMAMQQQQNMLNANMAQAQANASRTAGLLSMLGSIGGAGILAGFGG